MNTVVSDYPDREIHVILDNLSTHKPKRDLWLARHRLLRRHRKPPVVLGHIRHPQIRVGRRHRRDPRQGQLLRQAVLQRPERTLGPAPRLGRIRGNVLDPQLRQRPAHLRHHPTVLQQLRPAHRDLLAENPILTGQIERYLNRTHRVLPTPALPRLASLGWSVLKVRRGWARSSAVEHRLDTAGVTGSIPVAPTIRADERQITRWAPGASGVSPRADERAE